MKIGISTRLNHDAPSQAVSQVIDMDYPINDIELFCRAEIPHQKLSTLQELAGNHDITYYVHAPFLIEEEDLSSSQVSNWYWGKVEDSIEFADKLNSPIVTFHPGPLLPKTGKASSDRTRSGPTIVGRKYFKVDLDPLENLVTKAQNRGITLCIENLGKGVGADLSYLNSVIADFKHLGFTFDVGHANVSHNLEEMFNDLHDQIAHIHLHDNCGEKDDHQPLGGGNIDYPSILKRLDSQKVIGILELSYMEEIKKSLSYLESIEVPLL